MRTNPPSGTTAAGEQEAHQPEANAAGRAMAVVTRERVEVTETPDYPESPQPPHSTAPLAQQAKPPGPPRPKSLRKILQAVPSYNKNF